MTVLPSGIVLPREPERRPKPYGRRWSPTMGIGALINADGSVEWQDSDWQLNALCDEGETSMLNVYLKEAANPAKHLALIDGTTTPPGETSTMAYLGGGAGAGETKTPGSNGYNRQQILNTDWTDDGLISGDARFSAAEKTWGPATTGAWICSHAALVTAATGQTGGSGKFLLFVALSATTTIAVSQSFKFILRWAES